MGNVKQVIVVRTDLNMRKGKLASQVAHASMKFLVDNSHSERDDVLETCLNEREVEWLNGSFTKIVVGVDSEDALNDLIMNAKLRDVQVYSITDVGKTEFNVVPTLTCAAFGPDDEEALNPITGNLKLL